MCSVWCDRSTGLVVHNYAVSITNCVVYVRSQTFHPPFSVSLALPRFSRQFLLPAPGASLMYTRPGLEIALQRSGKIVSPNSILALRQASWKQFRSAHYSMTLPKGAWFEHPQAVLFSTRATQSTFAVVSAIGFLT